MPRQITLPLHNRKKRMHTKSRSGCKTCRQRRVKCNEEKPICHQCSQAKKTCKWALGDIPLPGPAGPRRLIARAVPRSISNHLDQISTMEDQRYFGSYCTFTAPVLSGYYSVDFWSHDLLPLVRLEPAVKHVVLALAALHKRYMREDHDQGALTCRYALSHYNQSIKKLRGQTANDKRSRQVVLVCCVVFTCVELLLRNMKGALTHLSGGAELIRSKAMDLDRADGHLMSFFNSPLVPAFQNFSIGSFVASEEALLFEADMQQPAEFSDLGQARNALMKLRQFQFTLEKNLRTKSLSPDLDIADYAPMHMKLSDRSQKWLAAFERLVHRSDAKGLSPIEVVQATRLRLLHKIISIMIANSLSMTETSYDCYILEFEEALSLAQRTIHIGTAPLPAIAFRMQVTTALYLVILKCRNPALRRRAVSLLKQTGREGTLEDVYVVLRVVELVIAIEEKEMDGLDGEHLMDSTGAKIPSERMRVRDILLVKAVQGISNNAQVIFRQIQNGTVIDTTVSVQDLMTSPDEGC